MGNKNFTCLLLFFFLGSMLVGDSLANGMTVTRREVNYTIADPTGDWGYPSPYTMYSRGPGYIRMSLIFDTLVWKNAQGVLIPALAQSWEYLEAETAFVFLLQENVTWHDGTRFTAEDVVFTFEYMEVHPWSWADSSVIKQIEKIKEFTVKFYLTQPYAPFLTNIIGTTPILPKHVWELITQPEEFTSSAAIIGTGPYQLADYNREHGTYLYRAYTNYYRGKPAIDTIKFFKISEEMAPTALLNDLVDAASIPPETVDILTDSCSILWEAESWNAKLMINHNKEPLSSKEFRQALGYAINRTNLANIGERGYAIVGSPGLIPPSSDWYNPEITQYRYNLEKAQYLIESLGYERNAGYYTKNDKILELELLVKPDFEHHAELIKQDLENLGIRILLKGLESKTIDTLISNWEFDLALSGHGGLGGDPEILNRVILQESFNSARYPKNEMLNQLLDLQLHEMSLQERKRLINEIQRLYAEELPAITLYYPKWFWAHDRQVNLYYTPGGIAFGIPIPINKLSFLELTALESTSATPICPTFPLDLSFFLCPVLALVGLQVAKRQRARRNVPKGG